MFIYLKFVEFSSSLLNINFSLLMIWVTRFSDESLLHIYYESVYKS